MTKIHVLACCCNSYLNTIHILLSSRKLTSGTLPHQIVSRAWLKNPEHTHKQKRPLCCRSCKGQLNSWQSTDRGQGAKQISIFNGSLLPGLCLSTARDSAALCKFYNTNLHTRRPDQMMRGSPAARFSPHGRPRQLWLQQAQTLAQTLGWAA